MMVAERPDVHDTRKLLDVTRYIEYYLVMLTYDVLAVLWEHAATDTEIARAVEARSGLPCSRNLVDQHLRLLRTTGHVAARNVDGLPAYALTESGSAFLARLAQSSCNHVL